MRHKAEKIQLLGEKSAKVGRDPFNGIAVRNHMNYKGGDVTLRHLGWRCES
jgi:hypothetical protein